MNELKIFENQEFGRIRTVDVNGEGWLVGKDVAEILGYKDTSDALQKHVDEEDKMSRQIADPLGRMQNTYIINESGLYSLVLGSKLEGAKRFKRWVTSEVLPTIRKHGMYATDELLDNPDFAIKVFEELKQEREKRKLLQAKVEEDKPKVLFADAVSTAKTEILIGELAKILKQNGIDTGEKRFFNWLRDNKYLISRKGTDYNAPTQKSLELGLFRVKETAITHSDGHVTVSKTTKVTTRGQQYFINKFLNSKSA